VEIKFIGMKNDAAIVILKDDSTPLNVANTLTHIVQQPSSNCSVTRLSYPLVFVFYL